MLYWNHSRFSVSLYEWLNSMHSKFQSHSYWQSLVRAVWISTYTNVRFLPVTATCDCASPNFFFSGGGECNADTGYMHVPLTHAGDHMHVALAHMCMWPHGMHELWYSHVQVAYLLHVAKQCCYDSVAFIVSSEVVPEWVKIPLQTHIRTYIRYIAKKKGGELLASCSRGLGRFVTTRAVITEKYEL